MKNIFVGNLSFGATEEAVRAMFEAYGAVMQEYVAVPDALFDKPKELEKWFSISFRYAKELKPKATKKK